MAIIKVKASEGQSIYDVNAMYYSGYDNLIKFCKDNGIANMNELDVSGKTLQYDTNVNSDLSTSSVIKNKGLEFVTGIFLGGRLLTEDLDYLIAEAGYSIILE